jgi:sulfonate transport system substrate-binding protein
MLRELIQGIFLPSPIRLVTVVAFALSSNGVRAQALPTVVPSGTTLTVADQNEELQTLMVASGEQAKLAGKVSYANFLGGPSILEAFRAHALDLAQVGDAPPIQAQAAGETMPIVAARVSSQPDYKFAVRPGLSVSSLADFRGKRISYGEGTGRQPFLLRGAEAGRLDAEGRHACTVARRGFPRCHSQRAGRYRCS